ncbi:MAG: serine/threonine-protein kinase [Ktedonobacteraceae bacterium]
MSTSPQHIGTSTTLADYIRSTSRMRRFPSAIDIVHLFASISIAIDYAHHHGMIHRNIKPGNILLDQRHSAPDSPGEPILTDFSIGNLERTSSDTQIDTALYLAPEQVRGYAGNELSDIYSLGVILYEICTGVPPFQGDTATAIKTQHINTMPTSPVLINPHITPALTGVILRSLAKDPALRFSSASSMSRALAEAFDVPVPENLLLSAPLTDEMNEPTYYKPLLTHMPPGVIPFSPSIEIIKTSSPPPAGLSTLSHQETAILVNRVQSTPTTPVGGIPAVTLANSSPNTPATLSSSPPDPTPPPNIKRRRKGLIIMLIALVLLVLVGSGMGTLFLLPRGNGNPVTTSQIVGHAYFVSSGKLNKDSTQGINDELLIKLHNVPDPAPGTSYYAWLLNDYAWLLNDDGHGSSTPMLLGRMPVHHGEVNQLYQSPHNTNLLTTTSRLLITEENINITPANPSPTLSNWRYHAELPQTPDPTDTAHHFSTLTHLRYLLSEDPDLKQEGLSGGLATWLARNTGKVLEWAGSARDNWTAKSPILLRNQLISILEYLDGQSLVQVDLPPHTPLLVDRRLASIPLLGFDTQEQTTPSYLRKINLHLTVIAQAPGTTPDKRELVNEINTALNYVKSWLKKVHDDAEKLVKLSDRQLLLPSSQVILDEMQTLAFYANVGRSDPFTSQVQAGVIQIQYDIERFATFDITPYTSK